jgi:hypothetical protein
LSSLDKASDDDVQADAVVFTDAAPVLLLKMG